MINERQGSKINQLATIVSLQGIPSQHTRAVAIKEGKEG